MTPLLSLAVRPETGTVNAVALAGRLKLATVGAVVSARVMVTEALLLAEMLPAASLAQA